MSETYTVASRLNMTSNVPEVIAQMVRGFGVVNAEIKATQGALSGIAGEIRSIAGTSRGLGGLARGMKELGNVRIGAGVLEDMRRVSTATRELAEQQSRLAAATRQNASAWAQMGRSSAAVARNAAIAPGGASGGASGAGAGGYGTATGNRSGRGGAWPPGTQAWAAGGPGVPPGGGGGNGATAGTARPRRGGDERSVDWQGMGSALQQGGNAGTSFLERAIMADTEVKKLLAQFRMNTEVDAKQVEEVKRKAEELTRAVPGTTVAENLHTILDAWTVTGHLGEALGGSKALSELNLLLQSLPGNHSKDPAFTAARAVELMQRFYDPQTHQVDLAALNKQIGAMAQVAAGTGGRASPDKYLGFAQQARVGGMVANDRFLYRDLPAMLIAMGGNRAGTGEAATFQQFITGRMTKQAASELMKAGLLNKRATWKGGMVQNMERMFLGFSEYGANPVDWVRKYMLDPKTGVLARNKIDPTDREKVAAFMSRWSGRQTGLGFMAEMVLGMGGIDKEAQKIETTSPNALAVAQQFDPNLKLREFHAAQNELMVELGSAAMGPALEALKGLTAALRGMTDWAKEHPDGAKNLMLVGGGMAVVAKVAGDLAMVVFVGAPLIGGLKALTFAVAGLEGAGAASAATSLTALGGAIGGIGAAVGGLYYLLNDVADKAKGIAHGGTPDAPKPGTVMGTPGMDLPGAEMFSPSLRRAPQAPGRDASGDGDAAVRPQSFVIPPSNVQTVQVNTAIDLDGRRLAEVMSEHLARAIGGPGRGTTGPDPRINPYSASLA